MANSEMMKNDYSKLKNDYTKLKSELDDTQTKHSEVATSFSKMASSISLEMNFIERRRDKTISLQCIKTALNPRMKDSKDNLVFRIPPITRRWTSSPFYILDGYKMGLVL